MMNESNLKTKRWVDKKYATTYQVKDADYFCSCLK